MANALPLSGLHVLEVASYLAAPLTCAHLTDLGARVTSIQRPAGSRGGATEDGWRPDTAEALARGKTLVTLDLKSEEGQERLAELIRSADVVCVGYSADVTKRCGLRLNPSTLGCARGVPLAGHSGSSNTAVTASSKQAHR